MLTSGEMEVGSISFTSAMFKIVFSCGSPISMYELFESTTSTLVVRQRVNYVTCRILLQSCVHSITNSLVLYHEARKETQLAVMRSKK